MQSIPVFLDIPNFADFSGNQWVCLVICIFFGSSLGKVYKCAKFHHCRICEKDFREGDILPWGAIREQPCKDPY